MVAPAKLEGQVFDMLEVVRRDGSNSKGQAMWFCRCACGNTSRVPTSMLRNGNTGSCGCRTAAKETHGESRTRLYQTWVNMVRRCSRSVDGMFHYYGGRGISVCEEWQSFEGFRDWALSNGYTDDLSIERDDNDIGYNPDNCRWIPRSDQAKNTRATVMVEFCGERMCLAEACRIANVKYDRVLYRYRKLGWDLDRAMFTPARTQPEAA